MLKPLWRRTRLLESNDIFFPFISSMFHTHTHRKSWLITVSVLKVLFGKCNLKHQGINLFSMQGKVSTRQKLVKQSSAIGCIFASSGGQDYWHLGRLCIKNVAKPMSPFILKWLIATGFQDSCLSHYFANGLSEPLPCKWAVYFTMTFTSCLTCH